MGIIWRSRAKEPVRLPHWGRKTFWVVSKQRRTHKWGLYHSIDHSWHVKRACSALGYGDKHKPKHHSDKVKGSWEVAGTIEESVITYRQSEGVQKRTEYCRTEAGGKASEGTSAWEGDQPGGPKTRNDAIWKQAAAQTTKCLPVQRLK